VHIQYIAGLGFGEGGNGRGGGYCHIGSGTHICPTPIRSFSCPPVLTGSGETAVNSRRGQANFLNSLVLAAVKYVNTYMRLVLAVFCRSRSQENITETTVKSRNKKLKRGNLVHKR
jgi:hypothetical protein